VRERRFDAHASINRSCELGMSGATGATYHHIYGQTGSCVGSSAEHCSIFRKPVFALAWLPSDHLTVVVKRDAYRSCGQDPIRSRAGFEAT
jgi:hypothetical protein